VNNEVYIHIGMHKTATTFLQQRVFSFYDKNDILYNPPEILDYLNGLFNAFIR